MSDRESRGDVAVQRRVDFRQSHGRPVVGQSGRGRRVLGRQLLTVAAPRSIYVYNIALENVGVLNFVDVGPYVVVHIGVCEFSSVHVRRTSL